LLVTAREQQHLHSELRLAWREDRVVPFLAEMPEGSRNMRSGFVAKLLAQHLGKEVRREMVAGWKSILFFDLWHRLVRSHGLPRPAARRAPVPSLLAAVEPTPATSTTGSGRTQ